VPPGIESDKSEYMNHCCEPNTVFTDDNTMIATRDVEVGEEICYDYATSETPSSSHMPFKCGCGKPSCRGEITGYDFLKPEIRVRYDAPAGNFFTTMVRELQAVGDAAAKKAVADKLAADAVA
jgi:hypothetical protein